jgi:thioredoxin 1
MVRLLSALIAIFFVATWCTPCQKAKPIMLYLMLEGYDIEIIDIDENKELANKYNVKTVPTLVVDNVQYTGLRTEEEYREILDGEEEMD